jgi:cytochrome c peroxidase
LALFNDESKGNCASCHLSAPTPDGAFPLFSDFGHIAIGVPRNPKIPANADARYHDLGLCGPLRTDFQSRPDYCGLFRTPSLRNVAVKGSYFHNGIYHSLDEVMRFYVQRDTDPQRFYSKDAKGAVRKYDDLPPAYWPNVNVEAPWGRTPGAQPALDDAEIRDVIAFLRSLTDADLAAAVRH